MKLALAMSRFLLHFALLALYLRLVNSRLNELRIGALIELKTNVTLAKIRQAAIDLAIKNIEKDWGFPIYYYVGDAGCNGQKSVGEFANLKYSNQVNAVIGPSCNDGCLTGGHLATYHSMVMVSHSCSSSKMSQKNIYPTFGRVRAYATASPISTTEALVRFFNTMKWQRIGMVHSNEDSWSAAADSIRKDLQKANISVPFHKDYIPGHLTSSADACMLAVKQSSIRSELSCLPWDTLKYYAFYIKY